MAEIEQSLRPKPNPFDKYFVRIKFWRILVIFAYFLTFAGNFHNHNLISIELKYVLVFLLTLAMLLFGLAHKLEETSPKVGVLSMLFGFALVVASLHTVGFMALFGDVLKRRQLIFLLFSGYISLLLILFKVFKEEIEINKDASFGEEEV